MSGDQDARELRLDEIRREAEQRGTVAGLGIRPAASPMPMPIASPENGYYRQPMLKEPQWTELVPFYFFVGGASGTLGVIGSLADVLGRDTRLAQKARWFAIGGATLSSVLLIADLGRPKRFLNMLRVIKPQSTMSVGSWVLSGFSTAAGISSFADLLRMRFGSTLPVKLLSAMGRIGTVLFGMPFHNYTGVLLGTTVVPVWNNRIHSLPREFGMSGLQAGVSLLELTGEHSSALNALALGAAAVEAWEAVDLLRTNDRTLEPAKRGLSGGLIQAAGVLSGPVPIALRLLALFGRKKRIVRTLAAVCGVVGSILLRYGWVRAGSASTRDWRIPLQIDAPNGPEGGTAETHIAAART